jgi:G3E family GTPase
MATSEVNASILFDDTSIMALSERIASVSHRRGHSEIETFTIIRDRPIPALALTMFLESISEHCGSRLLRLKGLVAIGEMPGRPAVIHGVRHVVNPPEFLGRWPSGDKRTRIVFIGRGLPRYFVPRLLEAIEEEVRDAIGAT